MTDQTTDNLLPWPKVQTRLAGLSRTAAWRLRKTDPTFPKAVPIGPRRIGWRESELEAWLAAQAAKAAV